MKFPICECCQKMWASQYALNVHLKSKKFTGAPHKPRPGRPRKSAETHCELCNYDAPYPWAYRKHCTSKKHQKLAKSLEES